MTMKCFFSLLLFLFIASSIEASRRWCFYTNWAQYRKGGARFLPKDIDASFCTHISYAFATLKNGELVPFEWNDDDTPYAEGMYKRVNSLKKQNPGLKTLLAIGGWNMGSKLFSDMVATKQTRQKFITSTISFLSSRNFDGLDICWEYPTKRGSPSQDKERFGLLLKELRTAFDENAKKGLSKLLLGIVVGSDENLIENAYDIDAIKSSVDAVSLLSYDFYSVMSTDSAVHTSALYASNITKGLDGKKNVEYTAKSWVKNGIPKNLINIGIALYGHSYRLKDTNAKGEGALISGPGAAGRYTNTPGFLAYYEVCEMINNGGIVTFMKGRGVPYLVLGNQWVAFENEESVTLKTKFALNEGYGGVMIWSFDNDDFSGMCPGGKIYPLFKAFYNAMQIPQTTQDPNWPKTFCLKKGNGLFGLNCKQFMICSNGNGFVSQCTQGQLWDKKLNRCVNAKLTTCT